MFQVTYYDIAHDRIDDKVEVEQFLHLLELYSIGKYVIGLSAHVADKAIDCRKLLSSLKFK